MEDRGCEDAELMIRYMPEMRFLDANSADEILNSES